MKLKLGGFFWARCCIILIFLKKIRVALESRTLIWVPLLQAMTVNVKREFFTIHTEQFRQHAPVTHLPIQQIGEVQCWLYVYVRECINRQSIACSCFPLFQGKCNYHMQNWVLLCSLDNLFQKNVIDFFFENPFQNGAHLKKGLFLTCFLHFQSPGKNY